MFSESDKLKFEEYNIIYQDKFNVITNLEQDSVSLFFIFVTCVYFFKYKMQAYIVIINDLNHNKYCINK